MGATITSNLLNQARQACQACNVPSFSTRDTQYTVRDAFTPLCTCTCADFKFRRQRAVGEERDCKHILFAKGAVNRIIGVCADLRDMIEDPLVTV